MGVWVLFRLLRSGLLERWREAREKKKKEESAPAESREKHVRSSEDVSKPSVPPSGRSVRSSGSSKQKKESSAHHREWKVVDEGLSTTRRAAEALRDSLVKEPTSFRLASWIEKGVVEPLKETTREVKSSGAVDRRRLRKALSDHKKLRYRLQVFRKLEAEREAHGKKLGILDEIADGLFRGLIDDKVGTVPFLGFCAHTTVVDESMRGALLEMGVVPIEAPVGWPKNITDWPEGFHAMVSDVVFARGSFLTEAYRKTGLSTSWAVPYSEPVYVDTNQVLGPFGSWLPGLMGDLTTLLLLGPAWAEALTEQMIQEFEGINANGLIPSNGSGWHLASLPGPGLRVMLLTKVLDTLNYKETAIRIEERWRNEVGECETLYMPTRRGSHYGVGVTPYLEAGHGLIKFLLDQSWVEFNGRKLRDLPVFRRQEVSPEHVGALVPSALAGRPLVVPMRQRISVALAAWVSDPEARNRIVRSTLFGLGPKIEEDGWVHGKKVYRGGSESLSLLSLEPKAILDSVILNAILQPRYKANRSTSDRSWPA